ncbi:hypothetical protein IHQ56_15210, partial [Methylobacillus flagellatus]|uniref:SGNH/GDSL hydrolase family protein n=1 Tax=Methylobacillus flagellatus TaxID=405 RepID=UPI002853D657
GSLNLRDANGDLLEIGAAKSNRPYRLKLYSIGTGGAHARIISGQLGGERGRVPNLFPNGQLDTAGDVENFADLLSTNSTYYTELATASSALAAYGVKRMFSFDVNADTAAPSSAAIYRSVVLSRGNVMGMVLVEKVSGDWVSPGPRLTLRYTDSTNTALDLVAYEELSSTVRLYSGTIAIPSGKTVNRVEVGFIYAAPRTNAFNVGGFWASHLPFSLNSTWRDTAWPFWGSPSSPPAPATIVSRIEKLEKKDNLKLLHEALDDSLHSVNICLGGDSNTWSAVATGRTADTPRGQLLSDTRNLNLDPVSCPSFANLFHDFLGRSYCGGALQVDTSTPDPNGTIAFYRQSIALWPGTDTRFRLINRYSRSTRSKVIVADASATMGNYLNMLPSDNQALEFDFVGDEVHLIYVRSSTSASAVLYYQIDNETPVAYSWGTAGPIAYGQDLPITTTFGKHRIRIWPTSVQLRVEAIVHNRKVQVRNQGIYGSNSSQWLPSAARLYPGFRPEDEFTFLMIGTNDNSGTGAASKSATLTSNLLAIGQQLLTDGKKPIFMTPPPEYPTSPSYNTWELSQCYGYACQQLGIPLIDNFRAFMAMPEATIRGTPQVNAYDFIATDNVHLSDLGHRLIHRNMLRSIGLSAVADTDFYLKPIRQMLDGAGGIPRLPSYTVAALPPISGNGRGLIYVTDGAGNKKVAVCDGTNWRFMDGAIVS